MVNFIIILKDYTTFSKQNIDTGNIPSDITRICLAMKEAFCLSYSIRKWNNLILIFFHPKILIKFNGVKLKYLGPDIRSQSLLLLKALEKSKKSTLARSLNWFESTPGIYYSHLSLGEFFNDFQDESINKNHLIVFIKGVTNKINDIQDSKSLYQFNREVENFNIFILLDESNIIKSHLLRFNQIKVFTSQASYLGDLILKINYYIDNAKSF